MWRSQDLEIRLEELEQKLEDALTREGEVKNVKGLTPQEVDSIRAKILGIDGEENL